LVLMVTERRFLPFALLLLMTALPDLVAILTRKPWVLSLLFLLGWNVLFGMSFPYCSCSLFSMRVLKAFLNGA